MSVTFNPIKYAYHSKRNVMYAKKGMVATSNPLAAQAGLDIMKKGGNAIDAAIATAACLTVVEPTGNGIGGDAFALVWIKDKMYGLNASGPSGSKISRGILKEKGFDSVPVYGFEPVTVPGIPSAWAELSAKYGRLEFAQLLEPAIEYARNGYPLAVNVSKLWTAASKKFKQVLTGEQYKYWFETFMPEGFTPTPGAYWKNEGMARTLQEIADTKSESFYRGRLAEKIIAFNDKYGGYLTAEDLAAYRPEWVEPIKADYRGYDVYEIPPNGHGITVLMALNIIKGYEFESSRETLDTYHKQIEAIKLAFADTAKYVTDPSCMSVSNEDLLSEAYAAKRRALIHDTALTPKAGTPPTSGTVYLATADEEGNMVSYIQSNYMGFGSGLVVPGTGIALHNRGNNFTMEEGHDNCVAPNKKPYHTIIPGFLAKGTTPVGPFGVMGGFMQPQGHLQMVSNTIDFHLNPQEALDAPRWQWVGGKTVEVEAEVPQHIIQGLARMGHEIKVHYDYSLMGRGQIIWRMADGVLCGGTEPRTDGTIATW